MIDAPEIIKRNLPLTIAIGVSMVLILSFLIVNLSRKEARSFSSIEKSGVLKAVYRQHRFNGNDVTAYALKSPEYQLLDAFARSKNLKLEVLPINSLNHIFLALDHNYGDLIFDNIAETPARKEQYLTTEPFIREPICIVAHKLSPIDHFDVQIEKNILIPTGSSYIEHAKKIKKTDPLVTYSEVNKTLENLLDAVAGGDLQFTICEKSFFDRYNNPVQKLKIVKEYSGAEPLVFILPKTSEELQKELNQFIKDSAHFYMEQKQ